MHTHAAHGLMWQDIHQIVQLGHREEEATETHGHITSLAVARTHRKLGLATKLMQSARKHQYLPLSMLSDSMTADAPLVFLQRHLSA